jgi:hypothetical protein
MANNAILNLPFSTLVQRIAFGRTILKLKIKLTLVFKGLQSKPGGLDLSRRGLDLDISKSWSRPSRKSWRFSKVSLDDRDKVSIGLDDFYAIKSRFVSIFIFVSIETRSRRQKKVSLDAKDVLDLDLSRRRDHQAYYKVQPIESD